MDPVLVPPLATVEKKTNNTTQPDRLHFNTILLTWKKPLISFALDTSWVASPYLVARTAL